MNLPKRRVLFVVGTFFGFLFSSAHASVLPPATRALMDANPGMRAMLEDGTLAALYGVHFATDADPTTSTDDFVNNFLLQHKDALGVENVELVFKDKMNIRSDTLAVYRYTQQIETLPVHGSRAIILVLLGATEKIGHCGMWLVQPPTSFPPDTVSETQAKSNVSQSAEYGHLTNFDPADLAIYQADDRTVHKVWRFTGYDDDEAYLFFVDTNTGDIVGVQDRILHGDVSGRVSGHATPCCRAHNETDPSTCPYPASNMLGILVEADGVITYAEPDGTYTIPNLPDNVAVTVETRLIGQWLTVDNVDSEAQNLVLTASEVMPPATGVNFVYNPTEPNCTDGPNPSWPPELDTSQVTAFLVAQQTRDWFITLAPDLVELDTLLRVEVNTSGTDALYNLQAVRIRLPKAKPAGTLVLRGRAGPATRAGQ